jgi:hypothetical protein
MEDSKSNLGKNQLILTLAPLIILCLKKQSDQNFFHGKWPSPHLTKAQRILPGVYGEELGRGVGEGEDVDGRAADHYDLVTAKSRKKCIQLLSRYPSDPNLNPVPIPYPSPTLTGCFRMYRRIAVVAEV